MIFASRYRIYRHGIRNVGGPTGVTLTAGGAATVVAAREIYAEFEPAEHILNEAQIQQAIRLMSFPGQPIDQDTNTHVHPRHRLSAFDSVRAQEMYDWTDDERELVEERLLKSVHIGTDHVLIEAEPAPLPWPTYDTDDVEFILIVGKKTNQVDEVLAYERENQKRPEVLNGFSEPEEAPTVVDAS
jgi:hypothetical protein